jgi:hypothetical protein
MQVATEGHLSGAPIGKDEASGLRESSERGDGEESNGGGHHQWNMK